MNVDAAHDRYEVAVRLFKAGRYRPAERVLREALAIEPAHCSAHALLALCLQCGGRPHDALGAANAALAIRPTVDALRARALAKVDLGDLKGAVAAADEAVALMPSSSWAAHTSAWTFEKSRNFNEAETQYRRSAGLAPGNAVLRAEYGRYLVRRLRLDEAEVVAAQLAPKVEINLVLLLLGEIALSRGRVAEARELALWILSRNAEHRQALILLALTEASRNPLLKLWWYHKQIISIRPVWPHILWISLMLAAGMKAVCLPILFFVYLRLARSHVNRALRVELGQVRLGKSF
jgi:Tfp pilus assembly protein PilF